MSWHRLIEQQSHIDYPASEESTGPQLIPLPNLKLVEVSGDEAATFLQNLLTNNVNALQSGQSQLNGFCNPKGRLLTVFQLIRRQQDFLLALPADLAEGIVQRLTMFKLRSKVDIKLADELFAVGIVNTQTDIGPESDWQGVETDEGLLFRQGGEPVRFLLIADQSGVENIAARLDQDWQLASESLWQLLNIEAGLPMVFADSKEAFTPQQINLDLAGGVSFKKGCYPGQEVVARLHYLGSPSRRLFLGQIHDTQLPDVNTAVIDAEGETLGHVVQAQFARENLILCQLSMKLSGLEKTALLNGNEVQNLTALAAEESENS